jgi:hypothetical protein
MAFVGPTQVVTWERPTDPAGQSPALAAPEV